MGAPLLGALGLGLCTTLRASRSLIVRQNPSIALVFVMEFSRVLGTLEDIAVLVCFESLTIKMRSGVAER